MRAGGPPLPSPDEIRIRALEAEVDGLKARLDETANDLSNFLTHSDVATLFLDTRLRVRRFTPAMTEILELDSGDVGKPLTDLASRVDDPRLLEDARRILAGGVAVEREVRTRRAAPEEETEPGDVGWHGPFDPTLRWYIRRIRPYRTTDSRIDGLVVTYLDVSALRRTANRLRRRERQVAAVAELGRAALAGEDPQPLFERTVKRVAEVLRTELAAIFELSPEGDQLLLRTGVGWREGMVGRARIATDTDAQASFTLHSSSPVIVQNLATEKRFSGPPHLVDHGVVSGVSVTIGPPSGAWGVLGVHSTRARRFTPDDTNFIQSVANVLWHALDRWSWKRTVQEQLAEIDGIYESAPVGLCFVDRDLRYVRINERLAAINGRSRESHMGKSITEVLPPWIADPLVDVYERVIRTGEPESAIEFRGATPGVPDPDRVWLVSFFPIRIGGTIRGVNTAVHDISDLKRAEERLREEDRHKDQFIATLAHELRNPLAAIRNATQVFELAEIEDQTLVDMSAVIQRQVRHMARLLDDLLDVSRIARGMITLRREPVDLVSTVQSTVQDLRGLYREEGVDLHMSSPNHPVVVNADATRLAQCLGNLLHNALKFTDPGGRVDLTVTSDGRTATVRVKDTGIGMDSSFLQHVFEPFRQADRSLHRTRGGLGLGLAMVRGLMELHGGSVAARSDGPGHGSELTLALAVEKK